MSIQEILLGCFSKLGFLSIGAFPAKLVDEGRLYYYNEVTALNNATRVIMIRTGQKSAYLSVSINAGVKAVIQLIRSPTVTNDGTATKMLNYNDDYPDDKLYSKLYVGSTITGSTGVVRKNNQAGFGTSPGLSVSGFSGDIRLYKLRKNTDYVYTIQMSGNSDIVFGMEIFE